MFDVAHGFVLNAIAEDAQYETPRNLKPAVQVKCADERLEHILKRGGQSAAADALLACADD